MPAIRETIELKDLFSPVMQRVVDSVNSSVAAMEEIHRSMGKPIDTGPINAARVHAKNLADVMRQVDSVSNNAANSMKQTDAAAKEMASASQNTSAQVNNLNNSIKQTLSASNAAANGINQTDAVVRKMGESMNGAQKSTENLGNQLVKIDNQLSNFGQKGQKDSSYLFEKVLKEYDSKFAEKQMLGESFNNAANGVGNLFMAFGGYKILGAVKSGFTSAAGAAIEFESAVTGVYKTVDGTKEQLSGLSDAVKKMATEVPSDVTEIAGVMESAGQLGIDTDNIESFSRTIIDLANSTNLTSEVAATSLAQFANITSMSAGQYRNLGSAIVDLGNNFATTETDIVEMSSRLASAAHLAGFTEPDILALSTAMSSVGINAEAGASSMSTLITRMQLAVETGDDLEDFAEVADMSMQQFSDTFENNAVGALQAFITGLNDVERTGASASAILKQMDLDDIRLSNTIRSLAGNETLLSSAVSTASQAWNANTALTNEVSKRYSTLESKLTTTKNAANNLKIAVGNTLTPAIGSLTDAAAGALTKLSELAEESPEVTAGFAGFAGTVGVTVGAIGTAAPTIASAVVTIKNLSEICDKAGKSLAGLAGKASLWGLGISAVIGASAALYTHFKNQQKVVEDYNGTLEQCRNEIDETQAKYDAVVSAYGSQSAAAEKLSGQLDTLNAQYQKGGGAAADYAQRVEEGAKVLTDLKNGYQEQIDEINNTQAAGQILAAQLEALSNKSLITSTDLDLMQSIAEELNSDKYHMSVTVDYETGKVSGLDKQWIIDQANANKKEAAMKVMTDGESIAAYQKYFMEEKEARARMRYAEDQMKKIASDPSYVYTESKDTSTKIKISDDDNILNSYNPETRTYSQLAEDYEKFQNAVNDAQANMSEFENTYRDAALIKGYSIEEADQLIDEIQKGFDGVANSADNAAESTENAVQAASQALDDQQKNVEKIQEAYEQSFKSIRSNLDSMFELFDKANELEFNPDFSTDNLMSNLESQLKYFEQYEESVNKLKELNLSDVIITQLSAEQAYSLADQFGDMGEQAAAEMVEKFNSKYSELSIKKDSLSGNLAESDVAAQFGDLSNVKTDIEAIQKLAGQIDFSKSADEAKALVESFNEFSSAKDTITTSLGDINSEINSNLDNIKQDISDRVKKIVDALDFSDGAAQKAAASMNSYANAIRSAGAVVVNDARSIAAQLSSALSFDSNITLGVSGSLPGHAKGTTNAEDIFIAGENGPELIIGKAGSTVFPASETNRIISAVSGLNPVNYMSSNSYYRAENRSDYSTVNENVVNNYNSLQSLYDDSKIIHIQMNLQIEKMWCEIIAGDNSQIYDFYEIHIPIMYCVVHQLAKSENKLLAERGATIEDLKQESYIFIYEFIGKRRKQKNNIKNWGEVSIQFLIKKDLRHYLLMRVLHTDHKPLCGDILNERPYSLDEPFTNFTNGGEDNKIDFVVYENINIFKSPEYNILVKERSLIIANKINELPDDLRKILILYYFKNKSHKEVYEICGFSNTTLSTKIRSILTFFRSDKDFTDYFDELKIKGFSTNMTISSGNGAAVCIRTDAENEAFVSDVCKVLLDNTGDIKKTLRKLKGKYPFLTYNQIVYIKNKIRYTSISDKFFPKNYFTKYDKLRYTKKYDLYDKDMNLIKHFNQSKDIVAYLKSTRVTITKYAKNGNLFKGIYYIRECE